MCVYIQCSVGNHIQPPRVPSEVCPQGPNHKLRGAARGPWEMSKISRPPNAKTIGDIVYWFDICMCSPKAISSTHLLTVVVRLQRDIVPHITWALACRHKEPQKDAFRVNGQLGFVGPAHAQSPFQGPGYPDVYCCDAQRMVPRMMKQKCLRRNQYNYELKPEYVFKVNYSWWRSRTKACKINLFARGPPSSLRRSQDFTWRRWQKGGSKRMAKERLEVHEAPRKYH